METKRLLIRNFNLHDIEACYQSWGQDKALGRYILNYPMTDRQQMAGLCIRGGQMYPTGVPDKPRFLSP